MQRLGGRPSDPAAPVRVASTTESMVSTAVLQFVEEGRPTLETPLEEVLPGLLPRPVVLRQLLDHTSGPPDDDELLPTTPEEAQERLLVHGMRGNGSGDRALALATPDGQRQVSVAWTGAGLDPAADPLERQATAAVIAGLAATCPSRAPGGGPRAHPDRGTPLGSSSYLG